MEISNSKPHVVLLCSPGLGHLIPVLELGKRLASFCNFQVSIFVVPSNTSAAEIQLLHSATVSSNLCKIIQLPPVDISGLIQPDSTVCTQISVIMREIRPYFRSALASLDFRPAAVIVDLFATESLEIAEEFGIPKYVFIASNAWFLALTLQLPFLDKEVEGEFVHQTDDLKIPGCRSVRPEDVVDPMLDRTNQQYFEYLRTAYEITKADGILLNTWETLEPSTFAAFQRENFINTRVFPIGPLVRPAEPIQDGSICELTNWLDNQPKESVLYISFGSGGTVSLEQMKEIAYGLELSQQRFIWIIRPPTIKKGDASFFTVGNYGNHDISSYLPDGFITRIKDIGRLIPEWSPQAHIMSHPSIGVFLSHCGWNSTLESLANGVPMITWPLYAEQKLNATLLAEEINVAVKPKILPSKGVVKREEIEEVIRKAMVDKNIRKRIKEIKESGENAIREGGTSYISLSLLVKEWNKISKN